MAGPDHGSDLDDVLDTLTEIGDRDINLIVTGIRNFAVRARTNRLGREDTQLLTAVIAASPDGTDLVGALGLLLQDLAVDTRPALTCLTDDARKTAVQAGQEAAFHLTHPDLRDAASTLCAALDHAERGCTDMNRLTDEQRKELSKKVADANKRSGNRPR